MLYNHIIHNPYHKCIHHMHVYHTCNSICQLPSAYMVVLCKLIYSVCMDMYVYTYKVTKIYLTNKTKSYKTYMFLKVHNVRNFIVTFKSAPHYIIYG